MSEALDIAHVAEMVSAPDLIVAGAGMGVDSGLPDFRGPEGFWRAYPPYRHHGLTFEEISNPQWFHSDPALAWGFYGHRLGLYRRTAPHAGYRVLRDWIAAAPAGGCVLTANVDGAFIAAGVPEELVCEHHGSIHHLQCLRRCGAGLLPADGVEVEVDPQTGRAVGPLPSCPACGGLMHPAILMFGDREFDDRRTRVQTRRVTELIESVSPSRILVIECGAGLAIPSVRRFSERLYRRGAALVRINPREPDTPQGAVSLPCGAREALERIAPLVRVP